MIKKIAWALVAVPVALLVIAFSVANRHLVIFSYDPLGGADPALQVRLPLFLLLLAALLLGILAGGLAAWWRQGKWRRTARESAHLAARRQREADELRARLDRQGRARLAAPAGEAATD